MNFRFESLEVYKEALRVSIKLHEIAENLNARRNYVFSDQLVRASLSITNNIAEGSGSNSKKEFAAFLNISRRSLFECANILIILEMTGHFEKARKDELMESLNCLSKRIQTLRNSILRNE